MGILKPKVWTIEQLEESLDIKAGTEFVQKTDYDRAIQALKSACLQADMATRVALDLQKKMEIRESKDGQGHIPGRA